MSATTTEPKIRLLYNARTKKVGCVLLQAVHGLPSGLVHHWDTDQWELAPTEGQGVYELTEASWKELAALDNVRGKR